MQHVRSLHIALAPRPWHTRAAGDCAFPVETGGAGLLSCCNPSDPATYCPPHRTAMRGPRGESAEAYIEAVLRWLEMRERWT